MKKQILNKRRIACFKRWKRKNWAAFASLHTEVKIGVLTATMFILAFSPISASAQSDTTAIVRSVEMEAVGISATSLNPVRGAATHTVAYLRDTLNSAPLQTAEQTLKLAPSVDIRERGAKGAQADISLRAGSPDQTAVMLNGVIFTDARTGHQSHSLPVDMGAISSIDIVSDIVGIGAYAGAVNIITSPISDNYLRSEIGAGQFGEFVASFSGAKTTSNNLRVFSAVSLRRNDGYMTNTDYENANAYIRLTSPTGDIGLLDIQAGYQNRAFGANEFYSFAYPNQFEATQTALGSVRWSADTNRWQFSANTSYRYNADKFELYRAGEGAPEGFTPNYHQTDNVSIAAQASYRWTNAGLTSFGADYTYNHIYSNVLGEPMEHPFKIDGADALYTKATSRSYANIWAGHKIGLGKAVSVSHIFGLAITPYGIQPQVSVTGSNRFSDNFDVSIALTRSMRLPTFKDLYYTTQTHTGDSSLKPEKALTQRIEANWHTLRWYAKLGGYYRLGNDVIDWIKDASVDGSPWMSSPIPQLHTFGIEGEVGYRGTKFLRQVSISGSWISVHRGSELASNYISRYALDYLRGKIVGRLSFALMRGLTFDANVGYYDRFGSYAINDGTHNYKPFLLADARLNYTYRNFSVYVDATNILNTDYADFGGLTMPPRWFTAGIVIMIND